MRSKPNLRGVVAFFVAVSSPHCRTLHLYFMSVCVCASPVLISKTGLKLQHTKKLHSTSGLSEHLLEEDSQGGSSSTGYYDTRNTLDRSRPRRRRRRTCDVGLGVGGQLGESHRRGLEVEDSIYVLEEWNSEFPSGRVVAGNELVILRADGAKCRLTPRTCPNTYRFY